jgi:hypothetical protein
MDRAVDWVLYRREVGSGDKNICWAFWTLGWDRKAMKDTVKPASVPELFYKSQMKMEYSSITFRTIPVTRKEILSFPRFDCGHRTEAIWDQN